MRADRKVRLSRIVRAIDDCVWPRDEFGFVRINAAKHLKPVSSRYNEDLRWLEENGYLERDKFYVPGKQSNGYRLLRWPDFAICGEKPVDRYTEPFRSMPLDLAQIWHSLHDLPSVVRWQNGDFGLSVRKGGRLYTPLTSMRKSVRRGLTINGRPACEVDIRSAQPFFVAALSGDRDLLGVVLNGDFYSFFGISRRKAKEYWGRMVHSGDVWLAPRLKRHRERFALLFPLAFEWLLEQEWRLKHSLTDRKVAHVLFEAESRLVIDGVLESLLDQGVVCGSVHDSIICEDGPFVADLIRRKSEELLGVAPPVSVRSVLENQF